mgnify:FL=1|jgi:MoxR-like ATPase
MSNTDQRPKTETEDRSIDPLSIDEVDTLTSRIVKNVEQVIVGQHQAIEDIVHTLLAGGHLLLEDVPGVGKTMLARSIATSLKCTFNRVQFTPDLLPPDVTGVNVYDQQANTFEFREGPVFSNILLCDEINRAPPKTQAALLEVMEEEQVTIDGSTYDIPDPFMVIATQNNIEPTQTYSLPVAEVDRFTKQIQLGYPSKSEETELLGRVAGDHPIQSLTPVATVDELRQAQACVSQATIAEPIRSYISRLAAYTRENAQLGVSPRGAIALLNLTQARAASLGRGYVTPDDIQSEIPTVWQHRIQTEADRDASTVIEQALSTVPVE